MGNTLPCFLVYMFMNRYETKIKMQHYPQIQYFLTQLNITFTNINFTFEVKNSKNPFLDIT